MEGECIICVSHRPKSEIVPFRYKESECKNLGRDKDSADCPAWCFMALCLGKDRTVYQQFDVRCEVTMTWPLCLGMDPTRGAVLALHKEREYDCYYRTGKKMKGLI